MPGSSGRPNEAFAQYSVNRRSVSALSGKAPSASFGPKSWSSQIATCDVAVRRRASGSKRALPLVPRGHRRRIEVIRATQVHVVAEPQHDVRCFRGDRIENAVLAAGERGAEQRIVVVLEEAAADGDRDVGRVLRFAPVRLRAHHAFAAIAVALDPIARAAAGRETRQARDDCVLARRGRVERDRLLAVGALGAPAHADRSRGVGLDPDEGARHVGVAVHHA